MVAVKYLITVDTEHNSVDEVVKAVRSQGISIGRVFYSVGAIEAIGDENDLATLRSINGIMNINREKGFNLPPINKDIPQ